MSDGRTPQEITEGAEAVQAALDPPWVDASTAFGYDEPETGETPLLALRVTPAVQILVNPSYQLVVSVKGTQAVINPAVLFDAVTCASQWIASHQPQPPREKS